VHTEYIEEQRKWHPAMQVFPPWGVFKERKYKPILRMALIPSYSQRAERQAIAIFNEDGDVLVGTHGAFFRWDNAAVSLAYSICNPFQYFYK
jgi:hypothetical protein